MNDCNPNNEQRRAVYLLGLLEIGKTLPGSSYIVRRDFEDHCAISLVASGELAERIDALLDEWEKRPTKGGSDD